MQSTEYSTIKAARNQKRTEYLRAELGKTDLTEAERFVLTNELKALCPNAGRRTSHMAEPLATLSLRIPHRLKVLLEKLSAQTGTSQNQLAADALEAYLKK